MGTYPIECWTDMVLIQIAAFSGEALKLDGVLEPKKAKKNARCYLCKAGAKAISKQSR